MIEVNERLCRFISQKTWNSEAARKLGGDLYSKVDLAQPSELMLEQSLLDILYEV